MIVYNPQVKVEKKVCDYLVDNYGEDAREWLSAFDENISTLSSLWNLSLWGSETDSRFGCILYARRQSEEVVVKMIPPFCSRMKQEINCYNNLPYKNMVEMIDCDKIIGALLLRRISNTCTLDIKTATKLFNNMFEQRIIAQPSFGLLPYANEFEKSINNALTQIETLTRFYPLRPFIPIIEESNRLFSFMFSEDVTYSLHGDAHPGNILYNGKKSFLIDPIGYAAPFEFEYARFIGSYIRLNDMYNENGYNVIRTLVNNNCSLERIAASVCCDVTMRACNTFAEGNSYSEIFDSFVWANKTWRFMNGHCH